MTDDSHTRYLPSVGRPRYSITDWRQRALAAEEERDEVLARIAKLFDALDEVDALDRVFDLVERALLEERGWVWLKGNDDA